MVQAPPVHHQALQVLQVVVLQQAHEALPVAAPLIIVFHHQPCFLPRNFRFDKKCLEDVGVNTLHGSLNVGHIRL